jgi:hypothetical protein
VKERVSIRTSWPAASSTTIPNANCSSNGWPVTVTPGMVGGWWTPAGSTFTPTIAPTATTTVSTPNKPAVSIGSGSVVTTTTFSTPMWRTRFTVAGWTTSMLATAAPGRAHDMAWGFGLTATACLAALWIAYRNAK